MGSIQEVGGKRQIGSETRGTNPGALLFAYCMEGAVLHQHSEKRIPNLRRGIWRIPLILQATM